MPHRQQQASFSDPYSFFSEQGFNLPPVISFHGKRDSTFNYQYQGVYFSPYDARPGGYGSLFQTEARCLPVPYTVPPQNMSNNKPSAISFGSERIYKMLVDNNIAAEYYLDCQMHHGLDDDCSTPGCYQSNFGTTATTTDATLDYIAGRAASFFQAIQGGIAASLNTTTFVECANYRIKCSEGAEEDDHDGCSSSDTCN